MEKTGPLKSALNSSSSNATNLASKILNIEDPLGESDQPKSPKDGLSNDQPAKGFGTSSFASILNADKKTPKINFRSLFNKDQVEGFDFVLHMENVLNAQNRFANSLVGFFVGNSVAFPLVQNYAPLRCDIDVEIVVVTAYNHDLWF
ncbi:hypothetical protein Tco_0640119 [Tanacetum coccineum]